MIKILVFIFTVSFLSFALPEYATIKPIKPVMLSASSEGKVKIQVLVEKGFHVQANPASLPNLIATTLALEKIEHITTNQIQYPKGSPHKVEGNMGEILAYDKQFEILVPISVASEAKKGKLLIPGKLRYQACNEKTCFFPMTIPLSIPVTIR